MKIVLGFCKRIDENSGVNYLQNNTVRKAQLGNNFIAEIPPTEPRVEAEKEK